MNDYMSITEAAVLWRTAPEVLHQECKTNRIQGAVRFGYRWMIPADAKCPLAIVRSKQQANES